MGSHLVKCPYCEKRFDANTIPYVRPSSRRYAHVECTKKYYDKNNRIFDLEIIDPTKDIVCDFCGKIIKEEESRVEVSKNVYAHSRCVEDRKSALSDGEIKKIKEKKAINSANLNEKRALDIELTDEDKLYECLMNIFSIDYVPPKVQLQVKKYVDEYKFTYGGIQRAITYWTKVKKGNFSKRSPSIGIVPHCYSDAYNYYYTLWQAQQNNSKLNARDFVPKVNKVSIERPVRREKRLNLFSFLDEEEVDGI